MKSPSIRKAVDEEDASALLRIAAEEARQRNRLAVYQVLQQLGSFCRVAFSDKAQTARIRLKCGEVRMEFSRDFVARYVETPADLLHLVLHELMHRVRGDLHRPVAKDVPEPLPNVAADILANADIDASVLGTTPGYFERLYPRDKFPENLLLPPWLLTGLPRSADRKTLERRCVEALKGAPDPAEAARIYLFAWLDAPSFDALLRALRQILPKPPPATIIFLGDHDGEEGGESWGWLDERLREWLRDRGRMMAGHGDVVREDRLDEPVVPRQTREFYESVRRALVDDPSCPRLRPGFAMDRGVVPMVGRREAFLLAGGAWPTFFRYPLPGLEEDERRAHVYVDASGSTRYHWAALYGLVLHLAAEIGSPVWLFSNAVDTLSLAELKEGKVRTTGGTDFDCIAEHALARRFRRILVVTDGEADLDGALARRLRQQLVGLFLVLTEDHPDCPLVPLAARVWTLPKNVPIVFGRARASVAR